jgi:serine/threonine-protein kinase RsbW
MASSPPAASNGGTRTVTLTIPAKAEYITLVRLALSGLSQLRPLDDETLGDLKLAVTEACSNSVRHAYRDGREGYVDVVYELHSDRLVVEVRDDGEGFPAESPGGTSGVGLAEGGLGIAIIRELADELELGPGASGKGSRLRFVKFIQD